MCTAVGAAKVIWMGEAGTESSMLENFENKVDVVEHKRKKLKNLSPAHFVFDACLLSLGVR